MSGTSTMAVKIVRNQKIDLHPRVAESTPPINGPRAGPDMVPTKKKELYFPLSRGSAISATQPEPILMTADPPVDCTFSLSSVSSSHPTTYLQGSQEQQKPV